MLIHNKVLYAAGMFVGMFNIAYGVHFCLENHHVAAIAFLVGGASTVAISANKIITGESEYLNIFCYFSKFKKKTGEEKESRQFSENIVSPLPLLTSDYNREIFQNLPNSHIQVTENKQMQTQIELQMASGN